MKLKDTLALIKAGYTKEEIRAFENEKDTQDPEQKTGGDAGIIKAIGLMADQLNAIQANFTKGTAAGRSSADEDINAILAKLQGSGKDEEEK